MYFDHTVAKAIYHAIKTNTGVFPPAVEQAAIEYDLSPIGDSHRAWLAFMHALSAHSEEIARMPEGTIE
jgi:hypothetical protein